MPKRKTEGVWAALMLALFCLSGVGPAWAQTAAAMRGPMRATDSPWGLLVGDYVGGSIVVLNPDTLLVEDTLTLPVEDQDPGPVLLTKPLGVAWMNGRVYVGDERSGAILVYRRGKKKSGGWVQVTADLAGFPIDGLSDIAADGNLGLLFVASKADKTVYVLDQTGVVLRTIGGPGSTNPVGQPQGLALDRAGGRIYVSDDGAEVCTWLGCAPTSLVQVYDYNGVFLGMISGESADENFAFSRVQGVTVDSFGDVYLVDTWRGQVLVFDEASANSWIGVGTFGRKGPGVKELLLPMDVVVVEASSSVYVTNSMKGRVEVFNLLDMVQ